MTENELYSKSIEFISETLREYLPDDSKFFIFGSRARGQYSRSSDIDIGIESSQQLDRKLLNNIGEIFDDSFVPYHVDLVDFSKVKEKFLETTNERIYLCV